YELLQGKTGGGLLAGAGAAYAYKRYRDARNDERRYGRYDRRRYRTSGNGDYRYRDDGYYGDDGYRSRSGSYRDDNQPYGYGKPTPSPTAGPGTRHYYDPRYGDGTRRYGNSETSGSTAYSSDGRPCPHSRLRNR